MAPLKVWEMQGRHILTPTVETIVKLYYQSVLECVCFCLPANNFSPPTAVISGLHLIGLNLS